MDAEMTEKTGREAIVALAGIYPQLYLTPGEEGQRLYRLIVGRGQDAPSHSLGHFRGSEDDRLTYETTPAGQVLAVTLHDRQDFELFLQIMSKKCAQTPIPPTQGAVILDGVINWSRIRRHQQEYLHARTAEGAAPDWPAEFQRFTAEPRNFKDALIILSAGPYSAVTADRTGYPETEWLAHSLTIRKYHECTHFVCRRLFPQLIDPLWDELVADAVGLYAAFGHYDIRLAELFLGVSEAGYTGGRLENYVEQPTSDAPALRDPAARLDALAIRCHQAVLRIASLTDSCGGIPPFELAIRLEKEKFPI